MVAVPGPSFVIVIVKTASSPVEIGPLPIFSTVTSGQLTTTVSLSLLGASPSGSSLAAATVAVFGRFASRRSWSS